MTWWPSVCDSSQSAVDHFMLFILCIIAIGLLCTLRVLVGFVLKLGHIVRLELCAKLLPAIDLKERFGNWAVVTGSTDGIGKAYATELARRGMNVVLISRSLEKLEKVCKDIELKFGVETRYIQADFSLGRPVFEHIKEQLRPLQIGILVNNVGVANQGFFSLVQLSEDEIWTMMHVNICTLTMMTRLVLPSMLDRHKGAIINISSITSYLTWPFLAVYSASKKYVTSLSRALAVECEGSGVVIQCLVPSLVTTNLTSWFPDAFYRGWGMNPSPSKFSRSAINSLTRSTFTTGYWWHDLQLMVLTALPGWLTMKVSHKIVRYMYNAERKAG